ncbi:MAG: hypothetical protein HZB55_13265 [Deltaproteobacteria bacterium]|nr:hypothetical protein [Deltaproteobacteria bacterium]
MWREFSLRAQEEPGALAAELARLTARNDMSERRAINQAWKETDAVAP